MRHGKFFLKNARWLSAYFDKPQKLEWWLQNIENMSRDYWLYIPSSTEEITFETLCLPINEDDLSPEEQDLQDEMLEKSGLSCFFYKDQLEDIISNLKAQNQNFEKNNLLKAINYYWLNDAFITIKST